MSTSPHKNWKGCAMCKPHKIRGQGRKVRDVRSVRKSLGLGKRYSRHEIPMY